MRKIIIFLIASIVVVYGAIGILYLIDMGQPDDHLTLEYRLYNENSAPVLDSNGNQIRIIQRVPLFYNSATGQNETREGHTTFLGARAFGDNTPVGHEVRHWSILDWGTQGFGVGTHIPAGKTNPGENIVVTAQIWEVREFTIHFHSHVAGAQVIPPVQVIFNQPIVTPVNPVEPPNAEFQGWFTQRTLGTGLQVTHGQTLSAALVRTIAGHGNVLHLHAQWTFTTPVTHYTLTFDANGGSFGAFGLTRTQTFPFEAAGNATLRSQTQQLNGGIPTRNGFTFWGWNPRQDGSAMRASGPQNPTGNPYLDFFNGDRHYLDGASLERTYYAVWAPAHNFTLTFDANGGTFPNGATTRTQLFPVASPTPAGIPAGGISVFQNLSSVAPTRTTGPNQSFLGWAFTPNATTVAVAHESRQRIQRANLTLYAVWGPVTYYTVFFNSNWAEGGVIGTQRFAFEVAGNTTFRSVVQRINMPNPTRPGFTFWGWNQRADGSMLRTSGAQFPANNPFMDFMNNDLFYLRGENLHATLYAVWSPAVAFRVTFNANGGTFSGGGDTRTQLFNVAAGTPGISVFQNLDNHVPTRTTGTNRRFLGWSTNPNATTASIAAQSRQRVQRADITLFAVWGP